MCMASLMASLMVIPILHIIVFTISIVTQALSSGAAVCSPAASDVLDVDCDGVPDTPERGSPLCSSCACLLP